MSSADFVNGLLNDGSETVCSQEDYVNRVSAADHCLAIDIHTSPARTINPTLITFVHGDSLNTKGQKYINAFLRAYPDAHEEDFIFIAITRPGYSNGRETSTGQHYYDEGDAYRAHTVMAVSEAILKLKEHYNAGQLVVMGHSGGANILANGLGYNEAFKPDTANGPNIATFTGGVRGEVYPLTSTLRVYPKTSRSSP